MLAISAENMAALQQRQLVARDFLWIVAREFGTGIPASQGFWSGVSNVSAAVINPLTGGSTTRSWAGAGSLISIGAIPRVATGSVQSVTIEMSQVHPTVEGLIRGHDCKQARIEIFRGLLAPTTRALVAPAVCRFVGFADDVVITTPSEGEAGSISLTAKSHTQEFTRANPSTRSDADQKQRSGTDNFFQNAGVVGNWEMWWGRKKSPPSKKKK